MVDNMLNKKDIPLSVGNIFMDAKNFLNSIEIDKVKYHLIMAEISIAELRIIKLFDSIIALPTRIIE